MTSRARPKRSLVPSASRRGVYARLSEKEKSRLQRLRPASGPTAQPDGFKGHAVYCCVSKRHREAAGGTFQKKGPERRKETDSSV